MLKITVLCCILSLLCSVNGQPAQCIEDDHCDNGLYCVRDTCVECIVCENYNRVASISHKNCIKSLFNCDACLPGFVPDVHGDILSACVAASTPEFPLWAAVVIAVVVLLLISIFVTWYVLRCFRKEVLTTRSSVWCVVKNMAHTATAPPMEPPPPYNTDVESPLTYPTRQETDNRTNGVETREERDAEYTPADPVPPPYRRQENTQPPEVFIQRSPSWVERQKRQSERLIAAARFNRPVYERDQEVNGELEVNRTWNDIPQDENTVESPWTPYSQSDSEGDHLAMGEAVPLAQRLHTARHTTLLRPPQYPLSNDTPEGDRLAMGEDVPLAERLHTARHTTLLRPPQYPDQHNTGGYTESGAGGAGASGGPGGGDGAGAGAAPRAPHASPSINIVVQMNAVNQVNER